MEPRTPDAPRDPREGRFLHVTQAQFWGSLAISLAIFLFATGPLWRHAADIDRLDRAIFWSYGAIPLLIAGCLLLSKRWSLRGFLLDTLALTVTKYVVTATVAIAFWATGGAPKGVAPHPHVAAASSAAPEPALIPTRIDPAATGTLSITVVDAAGGGVGGALAYVAGGLEGFVLAPPAEPLVLSNDGRGVTPPFAVAQVGQRIEGRSTDGRLHTLVVRKDGAALFNVPLLSSGAATTTGVKAGEATGLATVRCNVHPHEAEGRLLLVSHPFHARTDAAGRAILRNVPAGALRVAVVVGGEEAGEQAVQLAPGQTVEVRIAPGR